MIIYCPQCGAETTSGVYCEACTELLQAELEVADILDFAMQWCIDHFKVKAGLQPAVRAKLVEAPAEDAEEYAVRVFVPESANEVFLFIGEEADGFYVKTAEY
ncbi:MAG: hypothetical protein M3Z24_14395 [Chloroflexota bacterium]|nr:hypothetical protein [Chloroflexota bacterium]